MTQGEVRAIIVSVFAVVILLVIVPFHDWGVLAGALKAVALCGLSVLAIRRYLRRH